MSRERLDVALVSRGLAPSRARARDAVLRGTVSIDGRPATKPGELVAPDALVAIDDPAARYVSRSALKLKAALDLAAIDVTGRQCIDVGASTGGFTQVLIEAGAAHVTAIDVGHGQLVPAIAADARVTSIEGLNARDLTADHLPAPPEVIVCDVSFISLRLALPAALSLAAPGATLIALIKPQFEAGRDRLPRNGVIRDAAVHRAVCDDIRHWIETDMGWTIDRIVASPITGGDGNREFLMIARKP